MPGSTVKTMPGNTTAVSYTHLQAIHGIGRKHAGAGTGAGAGAAFQGMKFRIINLACLKAGDSLKHAVQVQHRAVDVYKRQDLYLQINRTGSFHKKMVAPRIRVVITIEEHLRQPT